MSETSISAINVYLNVLKDRFSAGISTEHSYRGDLENLLTVMCPKVTVTNEPKRQACGAPDYIITKKNIPIGYIEAKDVGKDLTSKVYKEQFDRYRQSLDNLIITDYLEFKFYRNAEEVISISIAKIIDGKVVPQPGKFEEFINLLHSFCLYVGQTIKSPSKLSKMMAAKARLLGNVIEKALDSDDKAEVTSTLKEQMLAFKHILIHDISNKEFADIYAQTIAYGMFAARLHDETLDTFSRQEAAELIPKSNPFLRSLFGYIAGPDIDDRIEWIVSDLADIFRATDVDALLHDFGKATAQTDPMIHFYETFLGEYDKKLKKARGVWYTPEPVVKFIVRAVDDILKSEFGLSQGLADTSKTKIQIKSAQGGDRRFKDGHKRIEKEVHKVQILDPATGTGTFLAEVVKHIYTKFENQQGIWSGYVEDHLIPRLNGFEILMASYAMAHLKLDLLLTELGYKPTKHQRLKVFLTNSLEEHHPDTDTLFATWLATEANEANKVKRDTPVMVVLGNPPYSGISSNNGQWITSLINDYKYVDGKHFGERKHWLNDDYVKFIRYGEYYIEKNKEGILAYITNHSFIENPTFRGMRWHLLNTFDEIYILNLNGNSKKSINNDENVFDIQQGVSINIFIKKSQSNINQLANVYYHTLEGKRKNKYEILEKSDITNIAFHKLDPIEPYYFFIPQDNTNKKKYETGFKISDLYKVQSMGVTSARDNFVIDYNSKDLLKRIEYFTNDIYSDYDIREKFFGYKKEGKYLKGDTRGWKLAQARQLISSNQHIEFIKSISYRPFDIRFIYYSSAMVDWGREDVMNHLLNDNYALCCVKVGRNVNFHNYFITNHITDKSVVSSLDNSNIFPLYLYPDETSLTQERIPNLDREIVDKIANGLDLTFTPEKSDEPDTFAPIELLDYIYAILHSPSYRDEYKEFLKIDFPRVPYPDPKTFWQLVELGGKIRQIHLLEAQEVNEYITSYPVDGDNTITRRIVKKDWEITDEKKGLGRVWINDEQYFDNIPVTAWEFYIGGYQPAQKWLKDRKERTLGFEDILHYQKIVKALVLTDQYMKEIDQVVSWK